MNSSAEQKECFNRKDFKPFLNELNELKSSLNFTLSGTLLH
jgi:hypothetical protein